jgi:hypothetical protein
MTTIGSASNNTQGYFSTKVADSAQRKDALKLMENITKYHKIVDRERKERLLDGYLMPLFDDYQNAVSADFDRRQALLDEAATALNDTFVAIESGVALPKNRQEVSLLYKEVLLEDPENDAHHGTDTFTNEIVESLKKHQNKDDSYNIDTLWQDTERIDQKYLSRELERLKRAARGVFSENPQRLFEKAAAYPETVRRLVDVLDLPAQNDKGWNLTSQAAKAGNPKLAKAFEKAGFGPNLHTKAVVDFAKVMTEEDAPNAQKLAALKELMGITPLS